MIACCSKCGKLFETTQEEAYTPGVLCVSCYKAQEEWQHVCDHCGAGLILDADGVAWVCPVHGSNWLPSAMQAALDHAREEDATHGAESVSQ